MAGSLNILRLNPGTCWSVVVILSNWNCLRNCVLKESGQSFTFCFGRCKKEFKVPVANRMAVVHPIAQWTVKTNIHLQKPRNEENLSSFLAIRNVVCTFSSWAVFLSDEQACVGQLFVLCTKLTSSKTVSKEVFSANQPLNTECNHHGTA
jgi:hypothetical protein